MNYVYSITLILVVSIVRCTEAWTLDSSCRSDGNTTNYQTTIENGMRQAFIYNEAALDALKIIGSQNNVNEPVHVAQHDLFQYLFRVAMKDGKIDPSYSKFKKVRSAFQDVKKFDKTGDGLSSPLAEDVPQADGLIVYCDWARFEEGKSCSGKKDAKVACDRDLQQDVAMGPLYKSCKIGGKTAPITFTHHEGKRKYAQIQMCSEYLKKSHDHPLKFWKDISLQALLAKPKAVMSNILKGANPIDIAAAGIGHTLFHDMIHAVGHGEIADVHVHETGIDGVDEGNPEMAASYGWANCLRFSPYGPNREKMDKAHALKNADNYAYFGLGASLISPAGSGKPQRVNPDGSLQVIPTSKQRRGNVHRRALAMPAAPRYNGGAPSNGTGSLPPKSPSSKPAGTKPANTKPTDSPPPASPSSEGASTKPTSTKPTDSPPLASPSSEGATTKPANTEPTSTKPTDLPTASPSSKPTNQPPASPSTKPTSTKPTDSPPASPSTKLATTEPTNTGPTTTKPTGSPPASPSSKPSSTGTVTTKPTSAKSATTKHTNPPPASPSSRPPSSHNNSMASTTPHTSVTPSSTAEAVITPRYDFGDVYGNYDFFDTAQSVLSALEANTVSPVTGITPTPSATFTTTVFSTTTQKNSTSTGHPVSKQKTSTSTGHPTTSASGLWCAPTGAASVGVPVEYARNNVTDFCKLNSNSMFGPLRFDLPVPDSTYRDYAQVYDLPGVTLHVNISLVTGEFNITKGGCNNKMLEILNYCAPYKKQGKAQHLLKFGGGIPVKGPKGTASFNISLEAHGDTSK